MKIGIISDTHSYLDKRVFYYFKDCDQIWHAGDIGNEQVALALQKFKPLQAVYGNIDGTTLRRAYPEDLRFVCAGLDIWITHIAGRPKAYTPRVLQVLKTNPPDILVAGHTHILRVIRDIQYKRLLYINPGAAGLYGIHTVRTILRFEIKKQKPCNMEVIELGKK